MSKKLIFADLHAHNYREFSDTEDGMNSRLLDCGLVLNSIKDYAVKNDIFIILFLGDLFHCKNYLHSRVIKFIVDEVDSLVADREIIFLPGNHDFQKWGKDPVLLELIEEYLPDRNKQIKMIRELGWIGNFYFEPFTRDIDELIERLKALKTADKSIFFGHQDVSGMSYGGYQVEKGLDPDLLSKKFRQSFIGHYHNPKKIRENVINVGAPLQHSFGDSGQERGWWIWDDEIGKVEFVRNDESPKFWAYEYDLANEKKEIPGDGDKDFYRITIKNSTEIPSEIVGLRWKRISFELESKKRRQVDLSFSDKTEDVLEKYVKIKAGELDKENLLEIGRRYL